MASMILLILFDIPAGFLNYVYRTMTGKSICSICVLLQSGDNCLKMAVMVLIKGAPLLAVNY